MAKSHQGCTLPERLRKTTATVLRIEIQKQPGRAALEKRCSVTYRNYKENIQSDGHFE